MHAVGTGPPRIARPALTRALADALTAGHLLVVAGPGYGKTTAVEDAIEVAERSSVWLSCAGAGREAERLLVSVVDGLRVAVPGSDVAPTSAVLAGEPV